MLELGLIIKSIVHLDTVCAVKRAKALVNEGTKTAKECVYELVLVGKSGLLVENVKYL